MMIQVGQRLIRDDRTDCLVEIVAISTIEDKVTLIVLRDDRRIIGGHIDGGGGINTFVSRELNSDIDWNNYKGSWKLLVGQERPTN